MIFIQCVTTSYNTYNAKEKTRRKVEHQNEQPKMLLRHPNANAIKNSILNPKNALKFIASDLYETGGNELNFSFLLMKTHSLGKYLLIPGQFAVVKFCTRWKSNRYV